MKNQTVKSEAPAELAATNGSADEKPYKTLPKNVLRLVLQVEDTPPNRIAMEACLMKLQEMPFPGDQKISVLKLEQIHIAHMLRILPNSSSIQ